MNEKDSLLSLEILSLINKICQLRHFWTILILIQFALINKNILKETIPEFLKRRKSEDLGFAIVVRQEDLSSSRRDGFLGRQTIARLPLGFEEIVCCFVEKTKQWIDDVKETEHDEADDFV